jgi:hypothetical protein
MVTREQRVYEQVRERDLWMTYRREVQETEVCIAPLVDPSESGRCSGRTTFDHVWQHAGGTKGKRPPTTLETVSSVCENHHLWTSWATGHRPQIREYIRRANEDYRRRFLVPGGPGPEHG